MNNGLDALKYAMDNLEEIDNHVGFDYRFEISEIKDAFRTIEQELKTLEAIKENLKYGYVFIGYNKDNKPLFRFADTNLYKFIELNK